MSPADPLNMFGHYSYLCAMLALFAFGALLLLRRVVLRGVQPKPATLAVPLWRKALCGLGLAAAALAPCILVPAALGLYNPAHPGWQAFTWQSPLPPPAGGLAYALMFTTQSLFEELFFRAIALCLLATLFYWQAALLLTPEAHRRDPAGPRAAHWHGMAWLISGAAASAVVSIAFGMVHQMNEGSTPLALVNIGLAGMVLGLLFWLQGDISGAWAMHWLWNTLQAIFGLPVSGMALAAPALGLGAAGAVPGLLTGGAFGPEGSVICTLTLSAGCAWLLWRGCQGIPGRADRCVGQSGRVGVGGAGVSARHPVPAAPVPPTFPSRAGRRAGHKGN
jgi:membrane protease YdiL (CAAX protease family)